MISSVPAAVWSACLYPDDLSIWIQFCTWLWHQQAVNLFLSHSSCLIYNACLMHDCAFGIHSSRLWARVVLMLSEILSCVSSLLQLCQFNWWYWGPLLRFPLYLLHCRLTAQWYCSFLGLLEVVSHIFRGCCVSTAAFQHNGEDSSSGWMQHTMLWLYSAHDYLAAFGSNVYLGHWTFQDVELMWGTWVQVSFDCVYYVCTQLFCDIGKCWLV